MSNFTRTKSFLLSAMLMLFAVHAHGHFKLGDKSNIGQTWTVNDVTGSCVLNVSFDPDKNPSSYTMDEDTAIFSLSKCQTNKGIQIEVRDTAGNAVYNNDFRCKNYRGYENPVYMESVASLQEILNLYENNVELGYTNASAGSDTVPAHCIFKTGEGATNGNGALGAWAGQWKDVKYIFAFEFKAYQVAEDITFDLSTLYEGSANLNGAKASYNIYLKVGSFRDTVKNVYTTGDPTKTISLATLFGEDPSMFSKQSWIEVQIFTEGTGTEVETDMFEPVIGIDNINAKLEAAVWMSPALGATANQIVESDEMEIIIGDTVDVEIHLQDANRRTSLTITNDNDYPKRMEIIIPETGALKANDGNGNYTVDVAYTYTASTDETKGSIVIEAPAEGAAEEDMMLMVKLAPMGVGEDYYRLEIDNGTRFWYDFNVKATMADLMHSYTFEDGTANDVVGGVNGTLEGTATVENGALVLDANGDYVSFDGVALDLNSYDAVTMEYLFVGSTTANTGWNWASYFGNAAGAENLRTSLGHWNDEIRVVYTGTEILLDGQDVNDGNIHHIVTVLTADSLFYYEDGTLRAAKATGGDFTIGSDYALLGDGYWNDPTWQGEIQEFNIYNGVMTPAEIKDIAVGYIGDRISVLESLTPSTGTLYPAFSPSTTQYVVGVEEGTESVTLSVEAFAAQSTIEGAGQITYTGLDTAYIKVKSADETDSTTYTVYIMSDEDDFMPFYNTVETLTPDPMCMDRSLYQGWGATTTYFGPESYGGVSCIKLVDETGSACTAALDMNPLVYKANTTYRVRAMVKTIGGSIGVLASGSDPNFGFAFDSEGEWMLLDTTFTTGAGASSGFFSFNTCDYSSNCTECYIDNYEIYENPPKKVAYVTEDQDMDATATPVDNDPIIQMLTADENIEIDVMVIAEDSVLELSMYDVVIGQESFGSSSPVWKRGGVLGMGSLTVPHIINKVYTMKDGRGFQDGAAGSGSEQAGDYYLHVDTSMQSHDLFAGLTFEGDSVQIFLNGYKDDGGADDAYHKGLQYAVNVEFSPADTALAMSTMAPETATVGINYLETGDMIGSETMLSPMITMCMNFGAISAAGGDNITEAGLTIWRNAVYILAGLEVPSDPIILSAEIAEVSSSVGTVTTDLGNMGIQLVLPAGTSTADLMITTEDPGATVMLPEISVADGEYATYEIMVKASVGTDSAVYMLDVHAQEEGEILYVSASNGVLGTAKLYDTNVFDALVAEGYSVTFGAKSAIFEWTPEAIVPFDYTPYAAIVLGGGAGSSNVNDYAKRNYPIPCVSMQNDGPKNNKWGWANDKNAAQFAKSETTTTESAQLKVINTDHYITKYFEMDEMITWTDGTPDSVDFAGKEVKAYNLMDSVPDAVALATMTATGDDHFSMYALEAGTSLRSLDSIYDNYETVTTQSRVVLMYLFNDGLLYANDSFDKLLVRSLQWVMDDYLKPDYVESNDGFVGMEAENYSSYRAGLGEKEGDAWELAMDNEGFYGDGYMLSIMTAGDGSTSNAEMYNAKLTYNIEFVKTGVHYVHVHLNFPDGSSDSFFYGLDGKASARIQGSTGEWAWKSGEISVAEPGVYTFDIMQREPGAMVDYIMITTDPDFTPDVKKVVFVTQALAYDTIVVDAIKATGMYDVQTLVPATGDGVITTEHLTDLNAADVVVMGRNIPSDKVGAAKEVWDEITAPVLTMNMYGMRSTSGRAFWTPSTSCENVVSNPDTVLQAEILKTSDPILDGFSGTLDWWEGMFSIFGVDEEGDDAGNGEVLIQTPDGRPLFMRWMKDKEFYSGAATPKGDRAYIGNGNDNTIVNYFGFSEAGETIFFRELARMASGDPLVITSISDKEAVNGEISVYPNPAKDYITFSFDLSSASYASLEVYNTLGQRINGNEVMQSQNGENQITIQTGSYNAGMYIYVLKTGNGVYSGQFSVVK